VIGIVIVAHGGLAREYLAAIEHVIGRQTGIRAISIEYDHDRGQKQAEITAAAEDVDKGDVGGSPSNLSLPACTAPNRRILYGANLPMLIKLAKSRDLSLEAATDVALESGRKYINSLKIGGHGV
jgi:mannose PTS system EIIA component